MRPIFRHVPKLELTVPWVELGEFPTPVERLDDLLETQGLSGPAWVKRDDLTSPIYGGNKVRTLEPLFAEAKRRGATHIYSTGAYGSNHAVATRLHAPRVGLVGGAALFPQPRSEVGAENLLALHARPGPVLGLPHWSALPVGIWSAQRGHAPGRAVVMPPGGATPLGGFGYVSAALELAEQVERGELERPHRIVVAIGSTCTTAGLLVGVRYAARLGVGFVDARGQPAAPKVVAVRVTPWPITSAVRIAWLAARISRLVAARAGDPAWVLPLRRLRQGLVVDGRFLGAGYGVPTEAGRRAIALFGSAGLFLDTTYSAKAAAGFLQLQAEAPKPTVFWATKSSAPLPSTALEAVEVARMRRWIRRAGRSR